MKSPPSPQAASGVRRLVGGRLVEPVGERDDDAVDPGTVAEERQSAIALWASWLSTTASVTAAWKFWDSMNCFFEFTPRLPHQVGVGQQPLHEPLDELPDLGLDQRVGAEEVVPRC